MSQCTVRYQAEPSGPWIELAYPADRLDELLARADARFLPAWTAQDEIRFRGIMAEDQKRRGWK